jgi:hypothetical protein
MAKKATDTYFDHLNDGRTLDRSEWDSSDRNKKRVSESRRVGSFSGASDVKVLEQDKEVQEFRAFFHGWGEIFRVDTDGFKNLKLSDDGLKHLMEEVNSVHRKKPEPTNSFLRDVKRNKEEAVRKKLTAPQ